MISAARKPIALLMLLAFIASAFLPFFATYDPAHERSSLAALFGERILLCTAEGFKWVDAEDIEEGKLPSRHERIKCPVCYLTAYKKDDAAPSGHALGLVFLSSRISYATPAGTRPDTIRQNHAQPRAPPFLA